MQADALLLCQYNIFEEGIDLKSINVDETIVTKDIIRVGQLFNRTIYLIWVKVYCFFLRFLCFCNDKIPIEIERFEENHLISVKFEMKRTSRVNFF